MLLFLGFMLFGKTFIQLWVGKPFLPAYTYSLLFLGALIIPLIQNTGILILQAKNKHAFRAVIFFIIALMNVAISIPLSKKYGALACAGTTSACLILGQGLILNMYYKRLGIAVVQFWKEILNILFPMSLSAALFALYLYFFPLQNSVLSLITSICLFTFIYILILWLFAFNQYEKDLIKKIILRFLPNDYRYR